jgi:hypothetical protein
MEGGVGWGGGGQGGQGRREGLEIGSGQYMIHNASSIVYITCHILYHLISYHLI